jgi:hypothetical protein
MRLRGTRLSRGAGVSSTDERAHGSGRAGPPVMLPGVRGIFRGSGYGGVARGGGKAHRQSCRRRAAAEGRVPFSILRENLYIISSTKAGGL